MRIHYIIWLVLSALSFAFGEFLSKKFALNPIIFYAVAVVVVDAVATVLWLPAILQRNNLAIVGSIWSVMSLLATVLIGVMIFSEKLSAIGVLGIVMAVISIILLSIA